MPRNSGDPLPSEALLSSTEAVGGVDAVSYTHLDVYKRQEPGGSFTHEV